MSPLETAKVQIVLEGEDARLYKRILNKKQFLIAAMKMFEQDDKLRLIFFNDETVTTQPQKHNTSVDHHQLSSASETSLKTSQPSTVQAGVKKGW